jgi:predicted ATPase
VSEASARALPKAHTRLIGRDGQLGQVLAQCRAGARCVTLLGPPGVGKTRLAIAVALELASDRPLAWVDLAVASTERELELAIAVALGSPDRPALADAIDSALAALDAVTLVLDNCEHVAPLVAPVVDRLLRRHDGASFLMTSRRALRLSYEVQVTVPPLARATDARELFTERLEGRRGPLQLDEPVQVSRIVDAVDGIPLALELAASRAGVLSLAELATRLEHDAAVLADPAVDRPSRQQSWGAAVATTFAMLEPSLRHTLSLLASFRGGFDLAAAAAVVAEDDVVVALEELRDSSLLEREESPHGARFRMYECLRQHAASELGEPERAAASLRIARHFAAEGALLADWSESLDEDRTRHLVADLANYRASWSAMMATPGAAAADLAVTLGCVVASIHLARGPISEAHAILDATLDTERCRTAARALVGEASWKRGHVRAALGVEGAESDLRRALELLPESRRGAALRALGALETRRGRVDAALELAARAFDSGERAKDVAEMTLSLYEIAAAERAGLRHRRALDAIDRAIALDERTFPGARPAMYHALRGDILQEIGRHDEADRAHSIAVAVVRKRGLTAYLGRFVAAQALGRWEANEDARGLLEEAVAHLSTAGDRGRLCACRAALAVVARDRAALESVERDAAATSGELARHARAVVLLGRAIFARLHDGGDAGAEGVAAEAVASPDPCVRLFRRVLARLLHPGSQSRDSGLTVSGNGRVVRWRGTDVDLSRRPVLARIVLCLTEARLVTPDRGLSVGELVRAVWPDERIHERAALNRLRVGVCELRRLGLRDAVETTARGYRLSPHVQPLLVSA